MRGVTPEQRRLAARLGLALDRATVVAAVEELGPGVLRALNAIADGRGSLDDIVALYGDTTKETTMKTALTPAVIAEIHEGGRLGREVLAKLGEREAAEERERAAEVDRFLQVMGWEPAEPAPEPRTFASDEDRDYAEFCDALGCTCEDEA